MFTICISALGLLVLATMATAKGPTSIFIDKIEGYALLADCAEGKLSAIVRGMSSGCGGPSTYESFACFCMQSSAKFSSIIGAQVATECPQDPSQNTTALQVFSSYCAIGQSKLAQADASTTFTSSSSSLALSATPALTPFSSSATPTTTAPPSSQSTSASRVTRRTAVIATATTVPIVAVVAIAFAAFFFYRHVRNKRRNNNQLHEIDSNQDDKNYGAGYVARHEISDKEPVRQELPSPDNETPELGGTEVRREAREQ